jgi:voltage-gated potassium channel
MMGKRSILDLVNRPTGSYLSIRLAMVFMTTSILLGVLGFMYFEGYSVTDAIYMTVITISTVGFQEVAPLSETGRIFTSILILINIIVLSYILSAFTYYVVEGQIFKQLYDRTMNKKIQSLKDHVIVCGYGKYGKEIVSHLHKHNCEVLIIERDESRIKELQEDSRTLFHIHDDATHDEILEVANLKNAKAIIAALPDDTDNLFIVLSARQLNPDITIISRAKEHRSESKLQLAGATHVIMPEQIGSFYMATLVSKPSATEFFAFISDEVDHDIGFAEISYENMPAKCQEKSIAELGIRKATGTNIIGYKTDTGKYIVNPKPDTILKPNTSFILVGNTEQLNALQEFLDVKL